jgi:hypothetical protein
MESRQLLNAHIPEVKHAHMQIAAASAHEHKASKDVKDFVGFLTGLAPYTPNPFNNLLGTQSYTAVGKETDGTASLVGTDSYSKTLDSKTRIYKVVYYAGSWTFTLSTGSTIAISGVGYGENPTVPGPYRTDIFGEAIGISGSLTGRRYSFRAEILGNEVNNAVSIKYSLKL